MMNVVLMGPPGVGKGTQAAALRERLGVPHVSTGDLLRAALQDGSDLGRKARAFVESGALVPDALVGELIERRLGDRDAAAGFVLDGFPRTVEQVEILDRVLSRLGTRLDRVVLLTAPEDVIVRRLSGRRICPGCGDLYHVVSKPPARAGSCDRCGERLVQRDDDREDVIKNRLLVYLGQTLPVAAVYRARGILDEVDGSGDPVAVAERLSEGIPRA